MPTKSYPLHSVIRLESRYTDDDGAFVDPDEVTFEYTTPAGTDAALTVSGGGVERESAGIYYVDLDVQVAGLWRYRWKADGGIEVASYDQSFFVRPSRYD